ncbi:uncharacterized protein PV07_11033 [Cladophialophora immunda]|uniref:Oxidoreductase FAD/NAD(P)-binding domain-containing protein n=1 Tax=Cladophialophora immunda TaxID=569365 RepID=A0A0D2AD23_9EURO|nr:uncharacterized protein PV07_11033 [Cladophialophora immunda]KIW22767.1 hypothetical protein PV07_11033 [Cladophialophora immunda]
MTFRVGGNFVYPPPTLNQEECRALDRVVFIAGGVGINPVMSMISAMHVLGADKLGGMTRTVRVLYASRREKNDETGAEEEILFEKRLKDIAEKWKGHDRVDFKYTLFVTNGPSGTEGTKQDEVGPGNMATRYRRIEHDDLFDALGPEGNRAHTVVYVCGLPTMTDEFVALLQKAPGMEDRRVLCEKWW